jgi:hypothetical protein
MQFPAKAKLAMQKILVADAELQNSVGVQACDSERQKQLASAVKVAVDEFINVAASLWPEFQTLDDSKRSTTTHIPPVE